MNNEYSSYSAQIFFQNSMDKKEIRHLGLLTGAALIFYILLQDIFISVLNLTGLLDLYLNDAMFQTGLDIIFSVLGILVPFSFFGNLMKKRTAISEIIPLGKPKDKKLTLLAIPAGIGLCMGANIVTSYIILFMQIFGFDLSSPEIPQPQGVYGFFFSLIRVSVIAAMVEELSLRGYTMQPLRKYGDSFAIAMSACAFGLMHCNLIQAPFALIVGIGLGYICIKTNSLWPSILIHALNNALSNCLSYLIDSKVISENLINSLYSLMVYGLLVLGIPCLVLFVKRANAVSPEYKGNSALSNGQKFLAYIFNPTMLIAIACMLYFTAQYISRR